MKDDKEDEQFKKFMSIFKRLPINITIVEALSIFQNMQSFGRNSFEQKEIGRGRYIVVLNENFSAILDKKLPIRMRDLGSFMIPCLLFDGVEEHALADSGASIMPYTIYMKLGLGELRTTRITLQLADRPVR